MAEAGIELRAFRMLEHDPPTELSWPLYAEREGERAADIEREGYREIYGSIYIEREREREIEILTHGLVTAFPTSPAKPAWNNTNRVVSNRVVSKGPLYPSNTKTVTLLMFAG